MLLSSYTNILEPRRNENSNALFMYREINPLKSYKQSVTKTPECHKEDVLRSFKIKELVKKINRESNIPVNTLEKQISQYLDEIGYEKELTVIRWLGLILVKLLIKALEGIYVNEAAIFKVKSLMGNVPIILVPSHRSYADFNIMSYLCFHYDIATPVIAAGIDFKGMAILGKLLRQVGAFYMRRSFTDTDFLYWQVFEQYIQQIVTKGDFPIEFFIEGTRSRTGKSLWPKLGLLTMLLKPLLTREVPDILFIPINVSYDRILEEVLFAYELLGVPKPKETTKGLFYSLQYLEQDYGRIYVTLSDPISAAQYFNNKVDHSFHNMRPLYNQTITEEERSMIPSFALEIIDSQQKKTVITVFNLISVVLLKSYVENEKLTLDVVEKETELLKLIAETFGGRVTFSTFKEELKDALKVHKNLIYLNEGLLQIVGYSGRNTSVEPKKLIAHSLSQKTMDFAVPFILLQEYINPIMYFFANPCIIASLLKQAKAATDFKKDIFGSFIFLRSLFSYEFVRGEGGHLDFEECWQKLIFLGLISYNDGVYSLGNDKKILKLLTNLLEPFLISYYVVCCLIHRKKKLTEKELLKRSQAELEDILSKSEKFIHPYILSLNTISNCAYSLANMGAIMKIKRKNEIFYSANGSKLLDIIIQLGSFIKTNNFTSIDIILIKQTNCSKL